MNGKRQRSSKRRRVTSVYGHRDAGDVIAGGTGQPDGGTRYVFWLRPSAGRDSSQHALVQARDLGSGAFGLLESVIKRGPIYRPTPKA
jgi:hypothetical protein